MRRKTRIDLGPKPIDKKVEDEDDNLKARISKMEFGNFPGYFNYRNKAAAEGGGKSNSNDTLEIGITDERLRLLNRDWFFGRDVLDIGCNRGHMTYAIARLFEPKTVVGIDIDLRMVNMANKDLHFLLESINKEARESRLQMAAKQLKLASANNAAIGSQFDENSNQFPMANYISHGPIAIASNGDSYDAVSNKFPNNVIFLEHNYVLASDELVAQQTAHFETIICMSVTKWIHLNFRDDGLKRFFKRIYNHLKPGGLLILEAQPFDNYKRRGKFSDVLKANYRSIQFKPEEFDAYLLSDQVGFKELIYESVTNHQCPGFKRPLKVFMK